MSALPVALVTVAVYLAVIAGIWRALGVRYDELSRTRATAVRGIVVPFTVGSALLVVVTSLLGWWSPVLFEPSRSGPTWALVVPVLMAGAALAGLMTVEWSSPQLRRILPALALGCLLVGFAEELATRGLVVVGARESGLAEVAVALTSMVVFSLVHAMNGFFGLSWRATVGQLGLSFAAGAGFYVVRMTTGSLLVCMVVHAVWDLGVLGTAATGRGPGKVQAVLVLATYVTGLVAVWFVATA